MLVDVIKVTSIGGRGDVEVQVACVWTSDGGAMAEVG
jgi:hypothetical protein